MNTRARLLSPVVLLQPLLLFSCTSVMAGVSSYLTTRQEVSCYKIVPATKGREEAIRKAALCWNKNSRQKLNRIASSKFNVSDAARLMLVEPKFESTQCWRIGFHHLCRVSARATARIETNGAVFVKPRWNGNRLDWCYKWGSQCGKPAADAFCKDKGFSSSARSFDIDKGIGRDTPTKVISTGKICSRASCDGFRVIVCKAHEISLE